LYDTENWKLVFIAMARKRIFLDGCNSTSDLVAAGFLPKLFVERLFFPCGGLSRPSRDVLLGDGVIEALLYCCQVGRAV
jgi:hypothetical protein